MQILHDHWEIRKQKRGILTEKQDGTRKAGFPARKRYVDTYGNQSTSQG